MHDASISTVSPLMRYRVSPRNLQLGVVVIVWYREYIAQQLLLRPVYSGLQGQRFSADNPDQFGAIALCINNKCNHIDTIVIDKCPNFTHYKLLWLSRGTGKKKLSLFTRTDLSISM